MEKYRVAQVGCGARGKDHLSGFAANSDRFELVGLCDLREDVMKEAAARYGITAPMYMDAETMLKETRPDVFCFVTQPAVRKSMVELAVKYGVKGLAFEKPMATSLAEAQYITELCNRHNIKTVVCHQHKYLPAFRKIKAMVEAGDIGEVERVHVNTYPWMSQLGTHYMDYALWISGATGAKWAVGHVHGKQKLSDHHPSPDFVNGTALLNNDIRLYFECGYLSPRNLPETSFWVDDRLTVYGSKGYVWAECNGRWGAFTSKTGGEIISGDTGGWGENCVEIQNPYLRDLALWLDGGPVHPSHVNIACTGYEILEAMCISGLYNTRIDSPFNNTGYPDAIERMREVLEEIGTYPEDVR